MDTMEMAGREPGLAAPERSVGAASGGSAWADAGKPDRWGQTEVLAKAMRRRFSAEYKRRILREIERCAPGEIAAVLRREGLYSSHLTKWRRQRDAGEAQGLEPRRRGKKATTRHPLAGECERLKRENERLQRQLKQAETIIDVQKKLCEMLGLPTAKGSESEE